MTAPARHFDGPDQAAAQPRPVASGPVLAALALVGAALVAGSLLLAPQPPDEGSPEVGFARDMMRHHMQAVAMAEVLRDRTSDPELRFLTQDIALTQQAQIGMMTGWLDVWGYTQSGSAPAMAWMGTPTDGLMPGMATAEEVEALKSLPVAQAEDRFLALMVVHHGGGVSMAEAGAALADRPEVVALASGIAVAQKAETEYFQSLRAQRGLAPTLVPPQQGHDVAAGHHGAAGVTPPDVVLWSLLTLGVVAGLWMLVQAVVSPTGRGPRAPTGPALVLVAGAVVSSTVHFVLTPSHGGQSGAYGAFFLLSALVLAAGAAFVLAGQLRTGAILSVSVTVLLVGTYVLFRVVPAPGAAEPEEVEAWGVTAIVAELLVLTAAVALLRSGRRRESVALA